MRIIRTAGKSGYVKIRNDALRDSRLSWRARGLLAELISYPDGWEVNVDKMVAAARAGGRSGEGREAMRNAMAELEKYGYATRRRVQNDQGRWVAEMVISDTPAAEDRRTDFRASVSRASVSRASAHRSSVDRSSVSRASKKKTDTKTVKKTDTKKEAKTGSLSSGPDATPDEGRNVPRNDNGEERERASDQVEKISGKTAPPSDAPYPEQRSYLAQVGITDTAEAVQLVPTIESANQVRNLGWWKTVFDNGHLEGHVAKARADLTDERREAKPLPPWCGRCDEPTRRQLGESGYGSGIVMQPCPRCSDKAEPPAGKKSGHTPFLEGPLNPALYEDPF